MAGRHGALNAARLRRLAFAASLLPEGQQQKARRKATLEELPEAEWPTQLLLLNKTLTGGCGA